MVRMITSKQLRVEFPKILRQVLKGDAFIVYYRAKPVMEIKRYRPSVAHFEKGLTLADIGKFVGHTRDRKPFSAVDLIREDRDT